jgi:tRNA A58 N-methylase Trm61
LRTTAHLKVLAECVGPEGTVIGLETNEEFARLARQFVLEEQLDNVEILRGDAMATGLPRASFDFVHARLVLVDVPEPEKLSAKWWH